MTHPNVVEAKRFKGRAKPKRIHSKYLLFQRIWGIKCAVTTPTMSQKGQQFTSAFSDYADCSLLDLHPWPSGNRVVPKPFTHSEVPTSPLLAQSYQSQLTTLGCRTLVADVPILHRRSHLFELPQDLHDWFPTAEAESHVCFKMASHRRTPFIWVPHFQPLWLDSALASCSVGWFFAPLLVRRSAASIGVQPLWLSPKKDAWKVQRNVSAPNVP